MAPTTAPPDLAANKRKMQTRKQASAMQKPQLSAEVAASIDKHRKAYEEMLELKAAEAEENEAEEVAPREPGLRGMIRRMRTRATRDAAVVSDDDLSDDDADGEDADGGRAQLMKEHHRATYLRRKFQSNAFLVEPFSEVDMKGFLM